MVSVNQMLPLAKIMAWWRRHEDDSTVHPRRVGGSKFTSKKRSVEQHRLRARLEY